MTLPFSHPVFLAQARALAPRALGEREYLIRAWREALEPMLELQAKIHKLEAELDAAVDAAWEQP